MIIHDFRVFPQITRTIDGDETVWGYEVEVTVGAEEGEVLDPIAWKNAMTRFFESMSPNQPKLMKGSHND